MLNYKIIYIIIYIMISVFKALKGSVLGVFFGKI